jgi:hypothetical protein
VSSTTTALGYVLAVPLIVALVLWWVNHEGGKSGPVGGSGRVVGIVGRMGSGKSYFAVRMAYRRLLAGANVCTNFTMQFEQLCDRAGCEHEDCIAAQLAGRWRRFVGWEQLIELEDCIVIVDEAHLYAPSNKTLSFPDDARWKLSMARKYRLDLYWLTQHENRVNTVLKDLTNMMYVCASWFSAAFFTAKGYEPEHMRRKDKHIDRKVYRFNLKIAKLYNTLEILEADGVHVGKGTRISELAQARNAKNGAPTKAPIDRNAVATKLRNRGKGRCEHERRLHAKLGTCTECA